MKEFSHINICEKISFIIGCKKYLILVVSKKTDKLCANCTSFNLALQALASRRVHLSALPVLRSSWNP